MNRILVTPRSLSSGNHAGLERLEANGFSLVRPTPGEMPSEDALLKAIPDCCGWIAGVEPVSDRVIEAARELRAVSRNGSGVDNLPLELLTKRGIKIQRAMAANANGVAELTLAMILAAFRNIPHNDRGIREGNWPRLMGREIDGATIGIVGLGAVGGLVALKFLALGAKIIGIDPFCAPEHLKQNQAFSQVEDLGDLISYSDGITLHAPLPAVGTPLISAAVLKAIKPGAVIINTARAGLVDSRAVLEALNSGQLATYATDVYDAEPPALSPLLRHDRCIMTSHIGGLTMDSVERITQITVDNLLAALEIIDV